MKTAIRTLAAAMALLVCICGLAGTAWAIAMKSVPIPGKIVYTEMGHAKGVYSVLNVKVFGQAQATERYSEPHEIFGEIQVSPDGSRAAYTVVDCKRITTKSGEVTDVQKFYLRVVDLASGISKMVRISDKGSCPQLPLVWLDNRRVLLEAGRELLALDTKTGKRPLFVRLPKNITAVMSACLAPGGKLYVGCQDANSGNRVTLWKTLVVDLATKKIVGERTGVYSQISPDGRWAVWCDSGGAERWMLWDFVKKVPLGYGDISAHSLSPDGKYLLCRSAVKEPWRGNPNPWLVRSLASRETVAKLTQPGTEADEPIWCR